MNFLVFLLVSVSLTVFSVLSVPPAPPKCWWTGCMSRGHGKNCPANTWQTTTDTSGCPDDSHNVQCCGNNNVAHPTYGHGHGHNNNGHRQHGHGWNSNAIGNGHSFSTENVYDGNGGDSRQFSVDIVVYPDSSEFGKIQTASGYFPLAEKLRMKYMKQAEQLRRLKNNNHNNKASARLVMPMSMPMSLSTPMPMPTRTVAMETEMGAEAEAETEMDMDMSMEMEMEMEQQSQKSMT